MQQLTLAFLLNKNEICLGYKKRSFGEGYWNGFGGKVKQGETPEESAVREIEEESTLRIDVENLEKIARIEFLFEDDTHLEVHTFFVRQWEGEPKETEEMRPEWFAFGSIPYKEMWEDDQHWLPRVLLGEKLEGKVWFDHTDRHIKEMQWQQVQDI